MGCTDFVVKYLLFVVNACVTIYGIVIIGAASTVIFYSRTLSEIVPHKHFLNQVIPIYFVVSGCIIFIVALFGSWGAIKEKVCLLNLYAVCMIILSAIKTFVVVIVYELVAKWEKEQTAYVELVMLDPDLTSFVNLFQAVFTCCGTTGFDSYEVLGLSIPFTCCPGLAIPAINNINDLWILQEFLRSINETEHICTMDDAYKGCNPILTQKLTYIYRITVHFAIVLISSELTVIMLAFYLAQHIRNDKYTGKRQQFTVRG